MGHCCVSSSGVQRRPLISSPRDRPCRSDKEQRPGRDEGPKEGGWLVGDELNNVAVVLGLDGGAFQVLL